MAEAPREYPKKIVIRSQNRIFLQTVAEIEYLTAAANYVHVHAAGQVFRIRSTMSDVVTCRRNTLVTPRSRG